MGVVSAVLKYLDCDWKMTGWAESKGAEWLGLGMYIVLMVYFVLHTMRARKENN